MQCVFIGENEIQSVDASMYTFAYVFVLSLVICDKIATL